MMQPTPEQQKRETELLATRTPEQLARELAALQLEHQKLTNEHDNLLFDRQRIADVHKDQAAHDTKHAQKDGGKEQRPVMQPQQDQQPVPVGAKPKPTGKHGKAAKHDDEHDDDQSSAFDDPRD